MDSLFRHCFRWFLPSPKVITQRIFLPFLLVLLCYSGFADASRTKPVVRPASATDTFTKNGATLDIDRHWGEIIDIPASGYSSSARVNVPVVQKSAYSASRIAGAIKNLLKVNPVSIAGTAGLLYLIDKLPGASFDPVTGQPLFTTPIQTNSFYWYSQYAGSQRHPTAIAACVSVGGNVVYQNGNFLPLTGSESQAGCWLNSSFYGTLYRNPLYCQYGATNQVCNTAAPLPKPMTDAQLDTLVSNTGSMSPSAWADTGPDLLANIPATFENPDQVFFDGPASIAGTPTITTSTTPGSSSSTVVESTPNYQFDYSSNPLSITTTTNVTNNTYQNGVLTGTTTTTQGPPTPSETPTAELDIPTDCEFMPTVCAFLDWFKAPAPPQSDPALPEITDSFEKTFSGPSLSATCPPPFTVNTGAFGAILMPVQPLCDLAGLIKYLVLSAAGLLAAFIISGTRRA